MPQNAHTGWDRATFVAILALACDHENQAVAFFMRSFQELREGQTSENKYKDLDVLPDLTEVAKTNN